MRCIIDCTELFCPRPSPPLKFALFKLKASCYIERLAVTFISCTEPRSISDKKLTK